MAKIWDKGYELDALLERFTVGKDYLYDRRLVGADAVASIAHARMLASVGLLPQSQCDDLVATLREIAEQTAGTGVSIRVDQEDSHTVIEEILTERLGDAGKRIHTGRSRNDQVAASTRLFAREGVLAIAGGLLDLVEELARFAGEHAKTPMAGRTHMQPAMPSTVGIWAASYAETLLEAMGPLRASFALVNRSPLGAAAAFGVPLPLDREMVSDLLGFDAIHHNVLAAVTARGHIEFAVLGALDQIGLVLGRLATDLILYSLPEFGYFSLPAELCSGSSIMPQKKNPDGLELMRAKSAVLSSYADRVRDIVRNLPSSYNRDVQETKEPLIEGLDLLIAMLKVSLLSIHSLGVDRARLVAGFTPDIFATDRALDLVAAGATFRDAYRTVAAEIAAGGRAESEKGGETRARTPDLETKAAIEAMLERRSATGSPGNPDLGYVAGGIVDARAWVSEASSRVTDAVESLVGRRLSLYPGTPSED